MERAPRPRPDASLPDAHPDPGPRSLKGPPPAPPPVPPPTDTVGRLGGHRAVGGPRHGRGANAVERTPPDSAARRVVPNPSVFPNRSPIWLTISGLSGPTWPTRLAAVCDPARLRNADWSHSRWETTTFITASYSWSRPFPTHFGFGGPNQPVEVHRVSRLPRFATAARPPALA